MKAWGFIIASLAALAGCGKSAAIQVADGSSAAQLTFAVTLPGSGSGPLPAGQVITVAQTSCSSHEAPRRTVWSIVPAVDGQPAPAPAQIRYGVVPDGFRAGVAARPLEAGCYESRVLGRSYWGWVEFQVMDDGSVRERTRSSGGS